MGAEFQAMPFARAEAGFSPMPGLGPALGAGGFVLCQPHQLVRAPALPSAPQIDAEPTAEAAPPPAPPPAPPRAAPMSEAAQSAALAAARAEGQALGRAEAAAELEQARAQLAEGAATLAAIMARMSDALEAETEALAQSLGHMVRALAAERAGQQITQDPPAFAARICALAARITEGFGDLALVLNPDDLAALQAAHALQASPQLERLFQAQVQGDAALARGDIRLRAQGLALEDLIQPMAAP
jgi:flagellar assembly protein FliH